MKNGMRSLAVAAVLLSPPSYEIAMQEAGIPMPD
jgi:hypothetical protein